MTFLQWRRFNFFDLSNNADKGQVAEKLKDCNITCMTSGRGQIILGDDEGSLYFITCEYQVTSYKAYDLRVSHVLQMKQAGILVTIGEDEPGINPLVKVWNEEKLDKQQNPMCVKITRAIPGNRPTPATAIAVHETLSHMAVGFADGSVVLYRGDITRNRSSKQELLQEGGSSAVTGMAFKTTPKATFLFVVNSDLVYSYNVSGKDTKDRKCYLDSIGCGARCSVLADSTQEGHFMIGRPDAVYCYTPDGRGPCYAFDGEKVALGWFRGYLVVVSRDGTKGGPRSDGDMDSSSGIKNIVTIFDTVNKFVTFTAPMREVMGVIPEWGSLCVLSKDKRLACLSEKDLHSKLSLLFKKNLYDIAIRIAKSQQYDSEGLIDIFRQYGDHLYSKGDHNGAVEQYIKTIGRLEPSYVIRKFLDAQRIHNLTAYLQALHKRGLATEDHTTLLLNCYTKLKDTQKLDEFIEDCEVDFDVETALKVCRQAGYFKHALTLAKKHQHHQWYLKIQIEDHKDYKEALEYIDNLPFDEAEENMKKYGSVLLENATEQSIELLKKLCTQSRKRVNEYGEEVDSTAHPEEFIHLFVNKSKSVAEFLEHMIKVDPNSSPSIHNTLIEYHLQRYSQSTHKDDKAFHEEKVMRILQSPDAKYNPDQALILCQMRQFSPGILYLYEKAKVYQHLLKYHLKNKDWSHVVATCRKFGELDPNLWVQALWAVSREPEMPAGHLSQILLAIEKQRLLSPLLVIDTLSNSSTASLGLVKDYLIRVLQAEDEWIAEDERLIRQYQRETEKIRTQIHSIRTTATIFQGSHCSACTHPLELPSVHFLCQHSYHQHCFESYSESELECPACSQENRKIQGIIQAQDQNKGLHEQFHSQLEKAEDGFSVLADYFGRGVFNRVKLVTDTPTRPTLPIIAPTPPAVEPTGAGAEAHLRVTEIRNQGPIQSVPESRIRAAEAKKEPVPVLRPVRVRDSISSSLEHHIADIPKPVQPPPPPPPKQPSPKVSARIEESVAANPFDDYDDSKNPFADDSNPFGDDDKAEDDDYDKNLNPFA